MNKVFCIGLGRTGTTTLEDCMRTLGYRHRGWRGAELGLMAALDIHSIKPVLDNYDSFDDYPFPLIYKQLTDFYPNAQFILTHRNSAARWAESVVKEYNRKKYSDSDNIWHYGDLNHQDRYSRLIERYETHQSAVLDFFSGSTNLLTLCWENGEGWEKLCQFLGRPTPQTELPHRNKSRDLRGTHLIDHLINLKNYNKILLTLTEQPNQELCNYTIEKLKHKAFNNPDRDITPIKSIIRKIKNALAP